MRRKQVKSESRVRDAVIADDTVRMIVVDLEESRESYADIALARGVHRTVVSDIAQGRNWEHITGGKITRKYGRARAGRALAFTEEQVRKIVLLLKGGVAPREIAQAVGANVGRIYDITSGKTWTNISGGPIARTMARTYGPKQTSFEQSSDRGAWLRNLEKALTYVRADRTDQPAVRKLLSSIEDAFLVVPAAKEVGCAVPAWRAGVATGKLNKRAITKALSVGQLLLKRKKGEYGETT